MDLKQLERFVVTAEEKAIGAASVRLNVSQPALTRSLHMLEDIVGRPLFERLPRGVRLTALGQALLPQAKLILNDRARFSATVNEFKGLAGGEVAFGLSPNLVETLGQEAVLRFAHRYPKVSLTIHTAAFTDLVGMLQDGELDFALSTVGSEAVPPDLTFEPLFAQMMSIMVGAKHTLASAALISFDELAEESWIVTGGASAIDGLRRTFEAHGAASPFLAIRCQSLALQKQLLLSGRYVAILDQEVVRAEIAAGSVTVLRTKNEGVLLRSGLLFRREQARTPAAKALAQQVREGAQGRRR